MKPRNFKIREITLITNDRTGFVDRDNDLVHVREVIDGDKSYEAFRDETNEIITKLQRKLDIAVEVLEFAQRYLRNGPLYDYDNELYKALTEIKDIK